MENPNGSHDRVWGSKVFPHGLDFQRLWLKV